MGSLTEGASNECDDDAAGGDAKLLEDDWGEILDDRRDGPERAVLIMDLGAGCEDVWPATASSAELGKILSSNSGSAMFLTKQKINKNKLF